MLQRHHHHGLRRAATLRGRPTVVLVTRHPVALVSPHSAVLASSRPVVLVSSHLYLDSTTWRDEARCSGCSPN